MKNTILLIDDDIALTELIEHYLSSEGFSVQSVHDGELAVKKALNQPFDAIILDIALPGLNGFEVLQTIRGHTQTPALILTGKNDDIDRMIGLEIGADDYLTKPCNPRELIARLKAILKRTQKMPAAHQRFEHMGIVLDSAKHTVSYHGQSLDLTNAEFNILLMLIKAPGQAFSKEELTEYGLGRPFTAFDRSIDVHISNLRNKLEEHYHTEIPMIKTVRGFGYVLHA